MVVVRRVDQQRVGAHERRTGGSGRDRDPAGPELGGVRDVVAGIVEVICDVHCSRLRPPLRS